MSTRARHFLTYLALLALLTLTTGLAFLDLGTAKPAVGLAIAALKAAIVAAVFMGLARAGMLIRMTAVALAFWLAVLVGLTLWVSLAS